ncbi:MFS transporter [Marivivens marinus]|uniref:MFS transporter n=1 Tax=Marivivens marinus TaxID=3110173 RepID=UPI003B8484AF
MLSPRAPVYVTHAPVPKIRHFALLAALEAGIRGMLLSVWPLVIYRAWGNAEAVSLIYLSAGFLSLLWGGLVPALARLIPRRWMTTAAVGLYLLGAVLGLTGNTTGITAALISTTLGTVTFQICLSAYVLDYIARVDLGQNESLRLVYSAVPWSAGPVLGVWLMNLWAPLPFLAAAGFGIALLAAFWALRLGDGKQITRARAPAPNPVAYLGRFVKQPRLVAGWLFAVIRSCGWWVFIVYLPIFCIENGLGDQAGAVALSLANGLLFISGAFLRLVRRLGVRRSVQGSFIGAGALFLVGALAAGWPWIAFGALLTASVLLVMLDVCGSLPFLMAVKPSERTEMAAVYASYRDVSGILTPAIAWAVLLVLPLSGVFGATALGMAVAAGLAGRIHPRLGVPRDGTKPLARA